MYKYGLTYRKHVESAENIPGKRNNRKEEVKIRTYCIRKIGLVCAQTRITCKFGLAYRKHVKKDWRFYQENGMTEKKRKDDNV